VTRSAFPPSGWLLDVDPFKHILINKIEVTPLVYSTKVFCPFFRTICISGLFVWLVADGWCWFVLREKYCWLVAGGWFVLREKYCWLVADKPSEQADHVASYGFFLHLYQKDL
jgi:hypothetical protein